MKNFLRRDVQVKGKESDDCEQKWEEIDFWFPPQLEWYGFDGKPVMRIVSAEMNGGCAKLTCMVNKCYKKRLDDGGKLPLDLGYGKPKACDK
jgi:hypothetical protein